MDAKTDSTCLKVTSLSQWSSIFIFILIGLLPVSAGLASSSLKQVHLIFRHGDRSPTSTFPSDPYRENAWPQGWGQLSKLGIQQEYKLGQVIRQLYNGFLNETYINDEVYMRSTDLERTLMSASSVLAGLYPPQDRQVWNENVAWQPIPVHTVKYERDNLLSVTDSLCDKIDPMYDDVYQSNEVLALEKENKLLSLTYTPCDKLEPIYDAAYKSNEVLTMVKRNKLLTESDSACKKYHVILMNLFQSASVLTFEKNNKICYENETTEILNSLTLQFLKEFLDMVRQEAGFPDATLYDIMQYVPNPLFCEKVNNMSLPEWVTPDVFNRLQDLKAYQSKLWFYTPEIQRLRGGVFLSEFVNHTEALMSGRPGKKVYFYSAHDTTISGILITLDLWDGLSPPYSSFLTLELHEQDGKYFIMLRYKNDTTVSPKTEPMTLTIKGCSEECEWSKFYEIINSTVYRGDWFCECSMDSCATPSSSKQLVVVIAVLVVIILLIMAVGAAYLIKGRQNDSKYTEF